MTSVTPHDRGWRLRVEQRLAQPLDELWPFYADAHNLEAITPPFLRFEVLTPRPIDMAVGTLIDYRLRLHGIPIRWRTRIAAWEPPVRFVDEQIRGPYRRWHHEHTFTADGDETVCVDVVDYEVTGGPFAGLVNRWFVQGDVEKIFAYRQRVLAERFGEVGVAT